MFSKRAVIFCLAIFLSLPGVARAEVALEVKAAIAGYSALYGLPEELVHRIVKRESKYNPKAYHRGHWGLMQIRYDTARSMGYRGPAKGLLDVDANLKYGVKYLAGAYLVAGGNAERAARYYRSGYYYVAKRKGLLEEAGLKRKR
ncbi:transglycosylase SLT domain-containing protein [Taklimakanibacter deserti]|uniref:transglycosylase SLT domain-containing protein n=1 Tax=Taklimakanibacter deserti TaxID=2267839 RepID=UPI000E65CAB6